MRVTRIVWIFYKISCENVYFMYVKIHPRQANTRRNETEIFFFFPSFFLSITFSAIERSYLSLLGSVGERTRASYRFNFLFLNTYRRSFLLGCGGYLVFYEPAVSNMRNYFSRSATSATSAGREILPSITVGLPNDRELLFHRLSEFLLKKKGKEKEKPASTILRKLERRSRSFYL